METKSAGDLFGDRLYNKHYKGILTYFVNHAVMVGTNEVMDIDGKVYWNVLPGAKSLGFRNRPYLNTNLMHYLVAKLQVTHHWLSEFLKPHQTTMVDVTMRHVVRE